MQNNILWMNSNQRTMICKDYLQQCKHIKNKHKYAVDSCIIYKTVLYTNLLRYILLCHIGITWKTEATRVAWNLVRTPSARVKYFCPIVIIF